MINLFRFTILRQAQLLPKEKQVSMGLRTHADSIISAWAQNLFDLCADNDHLEAHNECVTFLKSSASIPSYEYIATHSMILNLAVEYLRNKGKKMDAADFNALFESTKLNAYCTADPGTGLIQYETDKMAIEDTLFALAFVKNLGNRGNIDYMLVYRANQILNFSFNNGSAVTQQQLDALIVSPILIPEFVYDKCKKKYLNNEPFRHLKLEELPDQQGELPDPECECTCGEADCQRQNSCCAKITPFVTDLMIVREELKRYEPKHLAYIENIMVGEQRVREHRNLERTETFTESETEITKSLEKDHTVEDRFSLKTEIEKTLKEDLGIDAGVTFNGEFGTNKYSTNFSVSYDLSKTESQNIAQDYARNVITRSVSKVEEKVRELKSVKHISETEETNTHTFSNVNGPKHVVGQYHFVNMINKAQLMNYGKRLMYEFVLPEPMELYKELLKKDILPFDLIKPVKPHLRIPQVHPGPYKDQAGNIPTDAYLDTDAYDPGHLYFYQDLIAHFGLTGIDPLPDVDIFLPFSFENATKASGPNEVTSYNKTIAHIPAGYNARAIKIEIKAFDVLGDYTPISPTNIPGTDLNIEFFVSGQHSGSLGITGSGLIHQTSTHNFDVTSNGFDVTQSQELSLSVLANSCVGFAGSGSVMCELSAQAIAKWKTSVYEKIMARYQQDLEEFETARARYEQEKNAKLPFGNNPFINREIERTELKRMAISYISCQFYDQFTAMKRKVEPCGYPEMDLEQAMRDGMFIQFFEQLFDWNLMTYLFYPYFWGKKCSWPEKVQTNSGDPLFDKALMAGAVRVQVPVRLGHEPLALWWTDHGEIWQGQSEPPVPGSDYYVSMVQELKEQKNHFYKDRPGDIVGNVGVDTVTLNNNSEYWDALNNVVNTLAIDADINREIMINCNIYRIVAITEVSDPDHETWSITLDREIEASGCDCGELAPNTEISSSYRTGAIFVGSPFEVVVPTNLVFLRNIEDENNPGQYVIPDCLPCYPIKC